MEQITLLKLETLADQKGYKISNISLPEDEDLTYAIINSSNRIKTSESLKELYTYLLENPKCED